MHTPHHERERSTFYLPKGRLGRAFVPYALPELRPSVQNRNETAQRAERGGAPFPRACHSLVSEDVNISSQRVRPSKRTRKLSAQAAPHPPTRPPSLLHAARQPRPEPRSDRRVRARRVAAGPRMAWPSPPAKPPGGRLVKRPLAG